MFCRSYLALTFAPGLSTQAMPSFVTTTALDFLYSEFMVPTFTAKLPLMLWLEISHEPQCQDFP